MDPKRTERREGEGNGKVAEMMNPETNKFEPVVDGRRANGEVIPRDWPVFGFNEIIEIKNYRFEVKHIEQDSITFVPVGPLPKRRTKKGRRRIC